VPGGPAEVSVGGFVSTGEEEMATEWSDSAEEFSLPDEFLDDDFFSEEEKAAVAARSESDEEDSLAGLSNRLSSILGGAGDRKAAAKVGSWVAPCMASFPFFLLLAPRGVVTFAFFRRMK
jgi:hypothetical protein